MIARPEKYDEIVVNEDFERLELGAHKGIIKKVVEYVSPMSNKKSLKVEVDTATNDKQPSYFQEQYDKNTNSDKKWSNSGTKYVSLGEEEACVKMLKGFLTAVENSNVGFNYDWNKEVDQLNGKKIGLVFGLEEYTDQEGKTKTATKLVQFRSLDKLDTVKIPKVKTLSNEYIDYEEYQTRSARKDDLSSFGTVVEIGDELPF